MKTIYLPAGTEHVLFDELLLLIADALHPDNGVDDERSDYGIFCLRFETELSNAVKSGALPVKDAMTFGPHPHPVGRALQTALVSVHDLRVFLAGRPIAIELEPSQTAPVVVVSATNSTTPDPERRLARLRELEGNATYKSGEWKIIGISALVASEKNEGRKRSDAKTIRADLKEAAQNELEVKRANAFTGLGQK